MPQKWYKGTKHLPDSIPMEAIMGLLQPVVRFSSRPGTPPNNAFEIKPGFLPPVDSYFKFNETDGAPEAIANASGAAAFKNVILYWDLPESALFRSFEVYEGTTAGFTPDVAAFTNRVLTTSQTVVSIPKTVSATTWYYKVCAVNTRGERSSFIQLGPYTIAAVPNGEIASIAASKITAGSLAADVIVTANLSATKITSGTLNCSLITVTNMSAGSITTGTLTSINISGGTITGAVLQTSASNPAIHFRQVSGYWRAKIGAMDIYKGVDDDDGYQILAIDATSAPNGVQLQGALRLQEAGLLMGDFLPLTCGDILAYGKAETHGFTNHATAGGEELYLMDGAGNKLGLRVSSGVFQKNYNGGTWSAV